MNFEKVGTSNGRIGETADRTFRTGKILRQRERASDGLMSRGDWRIWDILVT